MCLDVEDCVYFETEKSFVPISFAIKTRAIYRVARSASDNIQRVSKNNRDVVKTPPPFRVGRLVGRSVLTKINYARVIDIRFRRATAHRFRSNLVVVAHDAYVNVVDFRRG